MNFLSFIIPIKNRADLFRQTIKSLIEQTDSHWEAIVVDDLSDDDEYEKIQQICNTDKRISLHRRTGKKAGASSCRNKGIDLASSDFIVFLDSDDVIDQNFITRRKQTINLYPECEMWVFPVQVFYNNPGDSKLLWNVFNADNDIDRFLNTDTPWHTTSPVWKKNTLLQLGGFDENLSCWQDWELHLRALISGVNYRKFEQIPDIFYRMHQGESIRKNNISHEALLIRYEAIKKIYFLMKTYQLINVKRKYLFAKLLINIYIFLEKTLPEKSEMLIDFVTKENLIAPYEWKIWLYRIKNKFIVTNKIIDKFIYWKYNDHFLDTKTTYLNAEIN